MRLGRGFSAADFARALASFRGLYNVQPSAIRCSPDVLERYCTLFASGDARALAGRVAHDGVALAAAVLPPGTIAFEGDVDENRMGDW